MALTIGTKAPTFTLKSKQAEGLVDVSLPVGKKTVLLFFPFAFTGVCKEELCTISGGLDAYTALSAEVLAISVDSPFAQEGFAQSASISVTLLSDFNKEVSAAYDVLYEDFIGFKGVSKRSAFVISESGEIVYAWSSDNPKDLPAFDEVQAALAH